MNVVCMQVVEIFQGIVQVQDANGTLYGFPDMMCSGLRVDSLVDMELDGDGIIFGVKKHTPSDQETKP